MKPIPFEMKKRVMQADLDDLNHVNNLRYIEWVLEISELHWKTKTSEEIRNTYSWVVLEQHIYYKHPVKLNEEINLKTWIASSKGVKSERKTTLHNAQGKLILEASTLWCLVDLIHQKPARITSEIVKPYFE